MEENSSSGTCPPTKDVLGVMRPEIDAIISAGLANITFTFDLMKHLATVATGVILVLAAFHEKFASGGNLRVAIPIATVSLLVTVLYSVKVCMVMWNQQTRFVLLKRKVFSAYVGALGVKIEGNFDQDMLTKATLGDDRATRGGLLIANWSFFIGICSVGTFIVANSI